MCLRGTIYCACGHQRREERICIEATTINEHTLFFNIVDCRNYRTQCAHVRYNCGIGKFYCAKTPCGFELEAAQREYNARLWDVTRLDKQAEILGTASKQLYQEANLESRVPPELRIKDPRLVHLFNIARAYDDEKRSLEEEARRALAFVSEARYNFFAAAYQIRTCPWSSDTMSARTRDRMALSPSPQYHLGVTIHKGEDDLDKFSASCTRTHSERAVQQDDDDASKMRHAKQRQTLANRSQIAYQAEDEVQNVRRSHRVRSARKVNYREDSSDVSRTPSPARMAVHAPNNTMPTSPQRSDSSGTQVQQNSVHIAPSHGISQRRNRLIRVIGEWHRQRESLSSSPTPGQQQESSSVSDSHSLPQSPPDLATSFHDLVHKSDLMTSQSYEDLDRSFLAWKALPMQGREIQPMSDPGMKRRVDTPILSQPSKRARMALVAHLGCIESADRAGAAQPRRSKAFVRSQSKSVLQPRCDNDDTDVDTCSLASVDWTEPKEDCAG